MCVCITMIEHVSIHHTDGPCKSQEPKCKLSIMCLRCCWLDLNFKHLLVCKLPERFISWQIVDEESGSKWESELIHGVIMFLWILSMRTITCRLVYWMRFLQESDTWLTGCLLSCILPCRPRREVLHQARTWNHLFLFNQLLLSLLNRKILGT